MLFNLFTNPILLIAWVIAVLIVLALHEFAHAAVAVALGDSTPHHDGRMTLDPRAHIDWTGLLMLIVVGCGWGKPVRFNPHNLRHPRWGSTFVALAGPAANVLGVLLFGAMAVLLLRFHVLAEENLLIQFLLLLVALNTVLFLFNLIPIPPLDGSKVLLELLAQPRYDHARHILETHGPMLLLGIVLIDLFLPFSIFGGLFSGALQWVYGALFFLT